jgi:hypothetical protein
MRAREAFCRCRPTHQGRPIDPALLDAGPPPRDPAAPWPFVIVPGYTPRLGWRGGLHRKAEARLEEALRVLDEGLAPALIVTGGAVWSPDNEAILMREWLLGRGVPPERIIVEPCARHTTTNLRNAGRIVLAHGHDRALVVTSDGAGRRRFVEQGAYVGFPWLSTFHLRCLVELGHTVGELRWLAPHRIAFRPSPAVFRSSWKERRAGDP